MAITRLGGANAISGTIPAANVATLTSSNLPTGTIIQITDQVIISTQQATTTGDYHDLTSATLNITPTSTSNKILLQAGINVETDETSSGHGLRFVRNGSTILTTNNKYMVLGGAADRYYSTFTYVDSPSSTSQLTYKIQVACHASRQLYFQNSAQSTFIAMEIKG